MLLSFLTKASSSFLVLFFFCLQCSAWATRKKGVEYAKTLPPPLYFPQPPDLPIPVLPALRILILWPQYVNSGEAYNSPDLLQVRGYHFISCFHSHPLLTYFFSFCSINLKVKYKIAATNSWVRLVISIMTWKHLEISNKSAVRADWCYMYQASRVNLVQQCWISYQIPSIKQAQNWFSSLILGIWSHQMHNCNCHKGLGLDFLEASIV